MIMPYRHISDEINNTVIVKSLITMPLKIIFFAFSIKIRKSFLIPYKYNSGKHPFAAVHTECKATKSKIIQTCLFK